MNLQQDLGLSRTKADPIGVPRSTRFQDVRCLTSLPAGRVVPLVTIPLLREDALRRASLRFSFEAMETTEILMNGMFVRVMAHFVSWLALDRFDGMDALNRSYAGIAVEGLATVPFIETAAAPNIASAHQILKYLGHHAKEGNNINTLYTEAYNQIWNFRARNRSPDLAQRTRLQNDLAPAFWRHQQFKNVVPSFDQAVIDGEVPLNIVSGQMPITGLAWGSAPAFLGAGQVLRKVGGTTETTVATTGQRWQDFAPAAYNMIGKEDPAHPGWPGVFAEMQANGITVSLSNIELARKTQAFARLKEQYQGIPDDYIVDLLMQGIQVPEQAFQQPILLGDASTVFGMSKRYSTDADAMTESVVNGATFIDLNLRMPQQNPGGVIMVTAEILPEQLFERQRDPMLYAQTGGSTTGDAFPNYLRDTLDPEKVEIVTNGQVDAAHATPSGTFGYAPLNWKWMLQQPRIGGKFYRQDPADGTNDEIRQRLWAVETINPTLAADFYISTNIHTKPFVVQNQDPFEVVTRGMALIEGNTVFGGALVESTGSYDEVMAEAPTDRLPTNSAATSGASAKAGDKPQEKPKAPSPKPA